LAKCKPYKDFGQGFYVTKYFSQAESWAKRMGKEHATDAAITEFEFNEYAYEDEEIRTLRFEDYNEAWLDFVVFNRSKASSKHEYDIIEGPVADDDITQRIDTYLEGSVSKTDFLEELKFHQPTHQIAFCTIESLQMLEHISKKKYIGNIDDAITQTLVIDYNMNEEKAIDIYFESKTYAKLIDENTLLYLKPWTEIYDLLRKELKL
jgi:hypothetical protein